MAKAKKIFLIAGLALLFIWIAYMAVGPLFRVSLVKLNVDERLQNNKFFMEKESKTLLRLNSYKGQTLWRINLEKLAQQIHALWPYVEIKARRVFPNRLVVSLKKKDSALLLLKEGGSFYSIAYDGAINGTKALEESFDFPVLRGHSFWEKPLLRKRAVDIVSLVPPVGSLFSVQNISEISYLPANDSLLFYLISGHFSLEIKEPPSLEKVKNIDFVLSYLKQRGNTGGWIDARWDKKIIVKMRD